jgi:hypothetical protein
MECHMPDTMDRVDKPLEGWAFSVANEKNWPLSSGSLFFFRITSQGEDRVFTNTTVSTQLTTFVFNVSMLAYALQYIVKNGRGFLTPPVLNSSSARCGPGILQYFKILEARHI